MLTIESRNRRVLPEFKREDDGRAGLRPSPLPPRALLSKAPEHFLSIRGVLLRGALGEGGNPSFVLANVPLGAY